MTDAVARLTAALADRYRIERELGAGGMATVYLAHDLKHDRPVALKVLHAELAAALGPERFEREIRLAARLQHPHILTVHDSGDAAGLLWFTMPFVEGESLRGRITREKQLPVDDAVRIAREAALGLDYAHKHGVIHRDIKPENLLLTTDGSTMVADFGIARAMNGTEDRLTSTGMAIGTPAYMSPEQATASGDLDARTDVYALGCVLYEMLAGEPPFTGPTPQAIIARAMTETPRPIHPLRPGVPASLDAAIVKAMAVTPADRYPSAAEFARALNPASLPATAAVTRPMTRTRPARSSLLTVLALGLLIGGGVLFALRRGQSQKEATGDKLLAVLPFENLGAPEDEYFADGVTDEVRGKLTGLPGLQVTARNSSSQYKKTTKTVQQVGEELGVQYLLTGTVRWEKGAAGVNRVHVSPELVQVSSGASKWQAPFDASLTDVFQVQADIAGRVAQALDVVLGEGTRKHLAEAPTTNLAAYDAFLRGEEASDGLSVADPASLRQAVAAYEQAVALDSTFVMAWARLARANSFLYANSAPLPAVDEAARHAAERTSALAPNGPEAHMAWGAYYFAVKRDVPRALTEDSIAVSLAPGNGDLLAFLAGAEINLGRLDAARVHAEQAERLDPRSSGVAHRVGLVHLYARHYPEARAAFKRAQSLAPANMRYVHRLAQVSLAEGDIAGARAVIQAAPRDIDPSALVAYMAQYFDLMWVLDSAQQALLLRLRPGAFDNDRASWALVLAQTYYLQGDSARMRTYADSARLAFEEQIRVTPHVAQSHVLLGLTLAFLGRTDDAIREGELGVSLQPMEKDAYEGAYYRHQLARIYTILGMQDKALNQLDWLLTTPYYLSPGWLRIDPNFDPLRGNPRFQKLASGT